MEDETSFGQRWENCASFTDLAKRKCPGIIQQWIEATRRADKETFTLSFGVLRKNFHRTVRYINFLQI